ncbi:hypothetical protein GCM10007094_11750 [Pseudovibrio japonicus]|uniref:Uncharacterized protein n=1 Tax=Pseudovibrio japonicus TaxID=366534 RepID=A0ABQ3E483_9HYPH|nr:hypothetical protein [Pseudovibrio japonicus]GHB25314.1 hypothetical protein GCM10007094_11750 [Pseudovibrio japonicus]
MKLRQATFICMFVYMFALVISAAQAQSYCEVRKSEMMELGVWENPQAQLKDLSRLEIEGECLEGRLAVRARAFTSCSPRDCKWGWADGQRSFSGALTFRFGGFFKSKRVEVRPMGERIQAYVRTENHDPTISDITRSYLLVRE